MSVTWFDDFDVTSIEEDGKQVNLKDLPEAMQRVLLDRFEDEGNVTEE